MAGVLTRLFAVLASGCFLQDLASQAMEVAKGTKGLDEVVDTIREHEMAILNSLVGGRSSCGPVLIQGADDGVQLHGCCQQPWSKTL